MDLTTNLVTRLHDRLDEMGEHDANEQRVDGLRAELDILLDTDADTTALLAFADENQFELGLDTGELPLNPATHIATLSANRPVALATARAASAEALLAISGRVAR